MVRLDGFNMAGPKAVLKEFRAPMRIEIGLGPPTPPGLLLGCIRGPFAHVTKGCEATRGVHHSNSPFRTGKAAKYLDLIEARVGHRANFKKVNHPFLPGDQKYSPQGGLIMPQCVLTADIVHHP